MVKYDNKKRVDPISGLQCTIMILYEGKCTVKWCVNTSRSPDPPPAAISLSAPQVPLSLPPFLPAGIIVLLSACYGLISLVAIFGNCLVIFVVG